MYATTIKPYIDSIPASRIQWVYNILEKKVAALSFLHPLSCAAVCQAGCREALMLSTKILPYGGVCNTVCNVDISRLCRLVSAIRSALG